MKNLFRINKQDLIKLQTYDFRITNSNPPLRNLNIINPQISSKS